MENVKFFAQNPHLLLAAGFDEYVSLRNRPEFKKVFFGDKNFNNVDSESLFRQQSGQWFWMYLGAASPHSTLDFHSKSSLQSNDYYALQITTESLLSSFAGANDILLPGRRTLWSPKLWTPDAQRREAISLVHSTRSLLTEISREQRALGDISWKQLEEIVAEVLRAHGMEIHVVRESPQGGRDVVARGELIPGQEPITLAVEVKHRAVVNRPEIEKALWQNRQFPALLFVTSGRFTKWRV